MPRAYRFDIVLSSVAAARVAPAIARAPMLAPRVDFVPALDKLITVPAVMPAHKERHLDIRTLSRDIAVCTFTTRRAARRARGRVKAAARLVSTSAAR